MKLQVLGSIRLLRLRKLNRANKNQLARMNPAGVGAVVALSLSVTGRRAEGSIRIQTGRIRPCRRDIWRNEGNNRNRAISSTALRAHFSAGYVALSVPSPA